MKKLYDEIMALESPDHECTEYFTGFYDGIGAAAELALKYDKRIAELENLLASARDHASSFCNN